MTLLFPDARDKGKMIAVPCPTCNTQHTTPYTEKKRTAEVCPRCSRVFCVEIFKGGTVVVE